jgi:hypothetical protein
MGKRKNEEWEESGYGRRGRASRTFSPPSSARLICATLRPRLPARCRSPTLVAAAREHDLLVDLLVRKFEWFVSEISLNVSHRQNNASTDHTHILFPMIFICVAHFEISLENSLRLYTAA